MPNGSLPFHHLFDGIFTQHNHCLLCSSWNPLQGPTVCFPFEMIDVADEKATPVELS